MFLRSLSFISAVTFAASILSSSMVNACGQAEWVCYVVPRETTYTNIEDNLRCYNPNVEHCVDDWVCARELNHRCGDVCYDVKTHVCHENALTNKFHLCHIGAKGFCPKINGCFDDKHYVCDPERGLVPRRSLPNPSPIPPMPVVPEPSSRPPQPVRVPAVQPRPVAGTYSYRHIPRR